VPGFVVAVDRGRFTVAGVGADRTTVTAIKARELGRHGIVVGDRVDIVGDVSGEDGVLARIVRRDPRERALRRSADDENDAERIVVANADRLAIVTSLAEPEPNPRFIDRCLVAAFDAGLDALIVATKADLASPDALAAAYRPLGVPVVPTRRVGGQIQGLDVVLSECRDRITVLIGSSGVGKSTLVNAMVPDALRSVGIVNAVTGRGRHTSTSAVALPLPQGGWIIDTPGIRTFGLAHVDADHFVHAFPDVAEAADACPRGCTHVSAEAGCALDAWADDPDRVARVESIRRLYSSRTAADSQ
jgi:ribosome biogenesis GTPase